MKPRCKDTQEYRKNSTAFSTKDHNGKNFTPVDQCASFPPNSLAA